MLQVHGFADDEREHLQNADRATQIEFIRSWFFEHYEDPAQNCPHDSGEGGYFYLWGGPYDANEVLREEFEGVVPDKVIQALVDELLDECFEWSAKPGSEDYDQYVADLALITSDQYVHCVASLSEVEALAALTLPPDLQKTLMKMLFVQVVTILETYLSDAFIHKVIPNDALLRKLVEAAGVFREEKIPVSAVFAVREKIADRVKGYLVGILWHDINKIASLYKKVLGVAFPDTTTLQDDVLIRHDCVHRNGKDKDGNPVEITPAMLTALIKRVRTLVEEIQRQLK